jgi:hypothetical protein
VKECVWQLGYVFVLTMKARKSVKEVIVIDGATTVKLRESYFE